MLSPALLATLITISEGPPIQRDGNRKQAPSLPDGDRKQATLIDTHLPELMM